MTEISARPPPPERLRNNIVIKRNCRRGTEGGRVGGRKNSGRGRRNQCLLTWPAKEFNYTGRIFLPLLRASAEGGGARREGRPFGRARGEFHFRVPHEDDGPPAAAVDGSRVREKEGSARVTCVARHDFARDLFIRRGGGRSCGDATRIIADSRPPGRAAEIREKAHRLLRKVPS